MKKLIVIIIVLTTSLTAKSQDLAKMLSDTLSQTLSDIVALKVASKNALGVSHPASISLQMAQSNLVVVGELMGGLNLSDSLPASFDTSSVSNLVDVKTFVQIIQDRFVSDEPCNEYDIIDFLIRSRLYVISIEDAPFIASKIGDFETYLLNIFLID